MSHIFVASQIGEANTDVRRRADIVCDLIVKPIADEFELQVKRSDRDQTPGPITSQILNSMLESKVVVVDLTGNNPNVYYELSFAHSFGLPVILLVDNTSNLPFDIKDERVIALGEGDIDMPTGESAKDELREALQIVLAEDYTPKSIVTEIANIRSVEAMAPGDPVLTELATLNRKVDQLQDSAMSARPTRSRYRSADIQQLMDIVSANAVTHGLITEGELKHLINDSTSEAFDDWVADLISKLPTTNTKDEDFDDIPF